MEEVEADSKGPQKLKNVPQKRSLRLLTLSIMAGWRRWRRWRLIPTVFKSLKMLHRNHGMAGWRRWRRWRLIPKVLKSSITLL